MNPADKALEFFKVKKHFQLGSLPTEQVHPDTVNLSNDSKTNLEKGISSLKSLDLHLLQVMWDKRSELIPLLDDIRSTIGSGGRIFLCGCGATGRLSIVLETLWHEQHSGRPLEKTVVGFMAGGDCALIKSIEKFEDFPEFGARQLTDLGFGKNDLLISTTEGGETPFVIGATEEATRISKRKPYFLYCNPDDILKSTAERSRRVIESSSILKINLTVGPMGLAGSTRMQASSILMLAVGLGLNFYNKNFELLEIELKKFIDAVQKIDFFSLIPFIERESEIYQNSEYLFYECNDVYGITIITDTTERSPTFSLHGFENTADSEKSPCLCYLLFSHCKSSEEAWCELLRREPRTFKWGDVDFKTDATRILGYDFSESLIVRRAKMTGSADHRFSIFQKENGIECALDNIATTIPYRSEYNLFEHTLLKFLLNIHSTLVMGRMGRYRNNIMTWVRPSNNKLIDRTVRYIMTLLAESDIAPDYDDLVERCYNAMETTKDDESIVEHICSQFTAQKD
ncbi:MAG: hypothetical protein KAG61_08775 [Bacteriovoracaceae bacterium]|nr:hypothetical protein [Bacteriovoracaceae bacterium]